MSSSGLDKATAANNEQTLASNTNNTTTASPNAPSSTIPASNAVGTADFLDVDDAFQLTSNAEDGTATLIWVIAAEHYLYQHAFAIEANISNEQGDIEQLTLTNQATFSQGIRKMDDYFGPVEVYYYQAIATFPLSAITSSSAKSSSDQPQSLPALITVKYQGCADAGLCYPVQTKQVELATSIAQSESTSSTTPSRNSLKPAIKLP